MQMVHLSLCTWSVSHMHLAMPYFISLPQTVSGLLRVYACCFSLHCVKGKGKPGVNQDMEQMLQSGVGWLQLDCRRFFAMLFAANYLLLLQHSPITSLNWVFLSWLPAAHDIKRISGTLKHFLLAYGPSTKGKKPNT